MSIVVPLLYRGNRRILFIFMIGILEESAALFKSRIRPGFFPLASVLTLGFSACAPGPGYEAFTWNATVAENVWGHLDRAENSFTVAGNRIRASPWLESFYRRREGRLAWSGPRGPLRRADELLEAIRCGVDEGLRPADYQFSLLEGAIGQWRRPGKGGISLVELDLLLSNAFLLYAAHLQGGRIKPQQIHPEWQVSSPRVDLGSLLQTVLELNRIRANLEDLRPAHAGYSALRLVLQAYRQIAAQGGWPQLRAGVRLRLGPQAQVLHQRLLIGGDLEPQEGVGEMQLVQALRTFQRRHGLDDSGQVDAATLKELNIPVEERIAQIELNMERWRWLPRHQGTRYMLVRIADFELDVVEDGEVVHNMRVIVGKPFWRTPIFSAYMTQLVFNPSWYVPESIAAAEILPLVRRDPNWLERRNFQVISRGHSSRVVAADSVNWEGITSENFPYRFTQAPGVGNSLGRVKFTLPNPFSVFLHDTPDGALFSQPMRAFSHGCIRLEKSLELAVYVLRSEVGWGREQVVKALKSSRTQRISLADPVPVYLL